MIDGFKPNFYAKNNTNFNLNIFQLEKIMIKLITTDKKFNKNHTVLKNHLSMFSNWDSINSF